MSTFTVGRISLDEIEEWSQKGDRISVKGDTIASSVTAAKSMVQNILGLADNPDEDIVPVTFSEDADLNGFYRVLSSQADTDWAVLTDGYVRWSMQLERVSGSGTREIESTLFGTARTGKPGGITERYWFGIPSDATAYPFGDDYTVSRAGGGWNTLITEGSTYANAHPRWSISPANYYNASAYVSVRSGHPDKMVGRQMIADGTDWQIGNSLITVGPPTSSTNLFKTTHVVSAGTGGTQTYDWALIFITAGPTVNTQTMGNPTQVRVLRNSPEAVTVQLRFGPTPHASLGLASNTKVGFYLTLTIRRGDRGVRIAFNSNGITANWGFGPASTAAFTAITADNQGLVETVADVDGNKRVIITALGTTLSTATGRLWGGSRSDYSAWIGAAVSAATGETASWLQDAYYAALTESQRVVP